jgi:hypothetical protein
VRAEPSLFGAGEQGVALKIAKLGAAGVINAIEGPGNAQYIDPRFACGAAPCFMVGGQDAWFLQTVIGKAAGAGVLDKLKMTLALTSQEQGGITSANGIATLPGKSPRRIIINARRRLLRWATTTRAASRCWSAWRVLREAAAAGPYADVRRQRRPSWPGERSDVARRGASGVEGRYGADPEPEHVAYADIARQGPSGGQHRDDLGNQRHGGGQGGGCHQRVAVPVRPLKRASRCYGVATYQSAGATVSGDLGYRPLNVPMTQMIQSGTFYHASGDVLRPFPPRAGACGPLYAF